MANRKLEHDFDEIIVRKGTDSSKHNTYADDVIPMWVADTDFKSPRPIIDALKQRAEHGIFGYTRGESGLESAAKKWMGQRFNLNIEEEWVVFTPSVAPALVISIQSLTNVGDKVVIQPPVYHPFHSIIENCGRQKVENHLIWEESKYRINFEELEEQVKDPRTKMLLLCNPHNPVGRVFSPEELTQLAELCLQHDVFIVSDEIHSDIVYEGYRHIPLLSISEEIKDRAMICINPSKTFNIPGLRTAAAIIPDKRIRDKFVIQRQNNKMNGETNFGLLAFEVAYNECEYYVDGLMKYLTGNLHLIRSFFKERIPEIRVIDPEATYLVWLDCSDLNLEQEQLNEFFLKKAKVALSDGLSFGQPGKGFMRMNFGCPRQVLQNALERIEQAVHSVRP